MEVSPIAGHERRAKRPTLVASLTTGAVLVASALLQLAASLERWVAAADEWNRTDSTIQDHRFDYWWPADPWENVGNAAELYGIGMLLVAVGAVTLSRAAGRPDGFVLILVSAVAASSALTGVHALVSGLIDAPTVLQGLPMQGLLSFVAFVALAILVVRWMRSSWPASVAAFFLLGSTLPGYLVALFVVAPAVAGFQSYDTTPWTETVVAVWTGLAGLAALAIPLARLGRPGARAERSAAQAML